MKGRILLAVIGRWWLAIGESLNLGLLVGAGCNLLFKRDWFNTDSFLAAMPDHIEWKPATA